MYLFQKTFVVFQNGVISNMEEILPGFPDKTSSALSTVKSRPPALLSKRTRYMYGTGNTVKVL